jgi:hypothetical protein
MLRFKPQSLIFLSGIPFFLAGFMLIRKGLGFISEAVRLLTHLPSTPLPLANFANSFWGDETTLSLFLIVPALFIGLFKGRKIIVPSVQQNLTRLLSLSNDAPLTALYDKKRWIVLCVMMTIGMLMNVLSIPFDIRGVINLAVGVALLQGGVASLRTFRSLKRA